MIYGNLNAWSLFIDAYRSLNNSFCLSVEPSLLEITVHCYTSPAFLLECLTGSSIYKNLFIALVDLSCEKAYFD